MDLCIFEQVFIISQGRRPLPWAPFSSSRLPFGGLGASILAPWGQQDGHEGVRNMMTESTLWSDGSCSGEALAFHIEGFGETGLARRSLGGTFSQKGIIFSVTF